ncbi:MAG: Rrf2 family transcriptional regulator [Fimbriimonas sp.]|nr:Rrf2 family transcriptional regulator [Fimbriimonas sp.]
MRLNAQTDFSLRILMYLASKPGGTATIQEISTRLQLSQTHLMRVAAKLVSVGFVKSQRGRIGGIGLALPASEITVEAVIRAMEPDFRLVECFGPQEKGCTIERGCALKGALSNALAAFFAALHDVTLEQLTEPHRAALIALFDLNGPAFVPPVRSTSPTIRKKLADRLSQPDRRR